MKIVAKIKMKFTRLLTLSSLALLFAKSEQDINCDSNGLKRFDTSMSLGTTFGSINQRFPENEQQLASWCKKTTKHLNTCEEYNKKCNRGLNKQVFSVFIYSVRTSLKNYCRSNSKVSAGLTRSAVCYNANKPIEMNVYTGLLDEILGIQAVEDTKKIPHLCCTYHRAIRSLQVGMEAKCPAEEVDAMLNYINSLTSNVLDLLCGDYSSDSDKCSQLGLPPKKKKSQRRSKSFALPVVEVLKSFKEV